MERKNPPTSIAAYKSLKTEELGQTYKNILEALKQLGDATFEDISFRLRCQPAKVWKRLSEMERMELIYRPGIKKQLRSKRMGYVWRIRANESFSHYANQLLQNQIIKPQQGLF